MWNIIILMQMMHLNYSQKMTLLYIVFTTDYYSIFYR